jgi:hypothetical protein
MLLYAVAVRGGYEGARLRDDFQYSLIAVPEGRRNSERGRVEIFQLESIRQAGFVAAQIQLQASLRGEVKSGC